MNYREIPEGDEPEIQMADHASDISPLPSYEELLREQFSGDGIFDTVKF